MGIIYLSQFAHARSGDKGSNSNIGVIALKPEFYPFLKEYLTEERVFDFFRSLNPERVCRYELPNLCALNFVLEGILAGGGSRSLRIDAQGKTLGQAILEMPIKQKIPLSIGDTMTTAPITCSHVNEAFSILTLNRPEKRNALSIQLMEEFCDALDEMSQMPKKRVLIINGAGSVFCAGLDLVEAADLTLSHSSTELVARSLSTLYFSPLITIAAVQGAAISGGAGLMSACDYVVASKEAKFGYPETRRGLIAAQVMPILLRQLRQQDIRELLLFGELIDVDRARTMGMVNRIVEREDLLPEAIKMAHFALKGSPEATKKTKQLLHQLGSSHFHEELELSLTIHQSVRESKEAKEGIAAYLEKRPPKWAKQQGLREIL